MKAILVIDLYDDDINLEELTANVDIEKVKDCGYDYEPYTKRVYCTLRPMPMKRETHVYWKSVGIGNIPTHEISDYDKGWNDCVEFLEGEENE